MKFRQFIGWSIGTALIIFFTGAHSTPTSQPATPHGTEQKSPKPQTPKTTGATAQEKEPDHLGPAPIESNWRDRALKWFKTATPKERRKEMRAVSRALKKPCKYCHTRDFKGFTQNRLITQQMMALSTEHGVECSECHAGRGKFTSLGEKARPMWKLVHRKKVFCGHCHTKQSKFQELTVQGKAFKNQAKTP